MEECKISELYYSGAIDDSYSLTSDIIGGIFNKDQDSCNKDHEGDEAQKMKHVETEENDENFDCCTIYDSAILKSMLDNLAICKYCRNELRFFSIFWV